jgi:hypothetical protein
MSHNYAYSVENWVHSTSLAQLDASSDHKHADDPLPSSPDDYYKSAHTTIEHQVATPSADMAAMSRPRPSTTNRVRSSSKPTPRSASGPASSAAATRSPPQVANKVKALAERFERSPGAGPAVASPALRSRSRDPTRAGAHDPVKRVNAPASSPASPARPSKEASYGSYKFNNLKPRERPQPAPTSPRTARRTNGSRSSIDQQTTPASTRRKVASPNRSSASSGRQPFFGEVVSGQGDVPGFGIPTFESTHEDLPASDSRNSGQSLHEPSLDEPHLPATSFGGVTSSHPQDVQSQQSSEQANKRPSRQRSPRSRIPVATRRLSAASDSSSSTRSVKYTPTRTRTHSNRTSPTRLYRKAAGTSHSANTHSVGQSTLPALAYRGYREQGKSPIGSKGGPSVPAVVTAPPPPTSPRLRNSRERQPLLPSPNTHSGSHGDQDYFPVQERADLQQESVIDAKAERLLQDEHASPSASRASLSVQTTSLTLPSAQPPLSATTDFEESPVLGIPGSFVLTPPTTFQEPEQHLLRPTVFEPPGKSELPQTPDIEQSELGVRESIPIMLSDEQPSQPWEPSFHPVSEGLQALSFESPSHDACDNRAQPVSRYTGDGSPIDPFSNRDTLHPDDSASIAPYRAAGTLAINQKTYSVINSILNLYHQSPVIPPELASNSRERIQQVSPVIAQHNDWGSKESTETYLARVLSDANSESAAILDQQSDVQPLQRIHQMDQDLSVPEASGTAIIYPSESRRYSRGSGGSTTTTIQEDASHSGSSSANPSQDSSLRNSAADNESASTNGIELPQLAWTNGGLGLSLHNTLPHSPLAQHAPPRPAYSPPPLPGTASIAQQATSADQLYSPITHIQLPHSGKPGEQFEMHPARSRTPAIQIREKTLEDRYGTPQPVEVLGEVPSVGEGGDNNQPDPAKQALIRRYRILEELLTTEHQFCVDMMIAHNIFEVTAQNLMSEKEKKLLFSNCKELEKFSLSLFRSFKKAAKPIVNYEIPPPTGPWNRDPSDSKLFNSSDASLTLRRPSEDAENQFESCTIDNDHQTTIGQVFLENREKMERLYTTYFLNQDNASAYIKKNQNNQDLSGWVVACFEQVENMTQAWDLDSLLLKPCQRLLKYPLLLEGLANASDPNHPDLPNIKEARKELLAINGRINEAKARSDTFRAAASEGKKEKSRGKGLGKTFVKAFIPKVDKSKAYDEADRTFKDQEYKSREQKFGGHFFQLQIVIRDFEQYLDSITEHYLQLNIVFLGFITVCEVAPSVYPEIESTWRKWAMAHFELQNKALEEHVSTGYQILGVGS